MKKLYLLLFVLGSLQVVFSQPPILTYETHGLLPGVNNPMTYCEYTNPGPSGENVIWNFSNELKIVKDFVGSLNTNYFKSAGTTADIKLEEFGNSFYFKHENDGLYQVGYESQDKRTRVDYDVPFKRIAYPMSYGQSYTTTFSGKQLFDGNKVCDLSGSAVIAADAYGTLTLPNNKTYSDVLRIKTEKTYTNAFENSSQNKVVITTYRWYNSAHRYPLLVLIEIKSISGTNESISYQAAYNSNAPQLKVGQNFILSENVSVFPNPSEGDLNVQIYSPKNDIGKIVIYDLTGKKVIEKNDVEVVSGMNTYILSNDIENLKPASYVVQISIDSQVVNREISIID